MHATPHMLVETVVTKNKPSVWAYRPTQSGEVCEGIFLSLQLAIAHAELHMPSPTFGGSDEPWLLSGNECILNMNHVMNNILSPDMQELLSCTVFERGLQIGRHKFATKICAHAGGDFELCMREFLSQICANQPANPCKISRELI